MSIQPAVTRWLPSYERSSLRRDGVAGLTVAAISVLAVATIADAAAGDDQVEVTIALSILTGLVFLAFRALRMGWIADLVPDPVPNGFIRGLVWMTILESEEKRIGVWVVNPSIRRRRLNEQEHEILEVTLPVRFEAHDDALEELRDREDES